MDIMNLIERWAQSQELGPVPNNRKFAFNLDQVRVHLLELNPGQVVLEARICDVPVAPNEREKTIQRAMQIGLARARPSSSHLMVDSDQSAFWLQRKAPKGADLAELDQEVEALVNDIELWRTAL
jgi:hypothetical protein